MCIRDRLTKAELTDVLAACGLHANVRGETLGLEGFVAPVSYTHLDVYKRQLH